MVTFELAARISIATRRRARFFAVIAMITAIGGWLSGCGIDPPPYVVAPTGGKPDASWAFGGDAGSSGGGSSSGTDGAASGDTSAADTNTNTDSGGTTDGGQTDGGVQTDGGPADGEVLDTASSDAVADTGSQDIQTADTADSGPDSGPEVSAGCGDQVCDPNTETCSSCPADCGICCGNKVCEAPLGETCQSCPADCGSCCGNSVCDSSIGETCFLCPLDCGQCCGDGQCVAAHSETTRTCPADCGTGIKCGDNKCDAPTETATNCPADCVAAVCGLTCHPVTQKNCSGTLQCYPNGNNATCTSPGSKSLGQTCEGLNECTKGLLCVNKLCKKLCDTGGAAGYTCGSNEVCDKLISGTKELPCGLGACFGDDACNLLTSVGCPATHNCAPAGAQKRQCVPAGTGAINTSCTADIDCQKNLLCLGTTSGGPKTCLSKCHTSGGSPKCAGGLKCYGVTTGNPPQTVGDFLGVCST